MRKLPEAKSAISPSSGRFLEQVLAGDLSSIDSLRAIVQSIPIQSLSWSPAKAINVNVDVLRADLLHPKLGGNKLFKLWGHLQAYKSEISQSNKAIGSGAPNLVSFGGAYSNHLYALAAIGEVLEVSTVGVIRGERPRTPSATLQDIEAMGMRLVFLDRQRYRQKDSSTVRSFLQDQHNICARSFWIPEGGAGQRGRLGCEYLGRLISDDHNYTHVVHACGTATSLAGLMRGCLASASKRPPSWLGISALRSDRQLVDTIRAATEEYRGVSSQRLKWSLTNQYHEGGFAKVSTALTGFMQDFHEETAIPIDRVYNGKVFYALADMLRRSVFEQGSRVLVIHSGGLQGNRK